VAKAVGLDIGSHSVKVMVLEGGPKGAALKRFAEKEYELDEDGVLSPAVVLDALRAAIAQAKAPKNVASLSVATEQCILREISVPFSQDEQIRKVVKFEFEPHLYSAAIEDVIVDYLRTGDAKPGAKLLIIALMKSRLTNKLEQLRQVGVDPLHVDVDVASLFNVAAAAQVFDEHPNCMIIDIGARTTKALYVQDAQLKVARSIRLGSKAVKQRTRAALEGDEEATQRALESATGVEALAQAPAGVADTVDIVVSVEQLESAVAQERQGNFMDRVLRETQRTMPIVAADHRPTCIFLTGGGAQHANARQRISEHFGVEVADLPILEAVTHDLPPSDAAKIAASGAVALGTALKVLGIDAGGIEMRREEFRFARKFDAIKTPLAWGVSFLFLSAFLLFLTEFMAYRRADAQVRALRAEYQAEVDGDVFDAYTERLGDNARKLPSPPADRPELYFRAYSNNVKKVRDHLKNELGLAAEIPQITSCVRLWSTVMESVQKVRPKINYLAIKTEDYKQAGVRITVIVEEFDDGTLLVNELRKHTNIFAKVEAKNPKTTKEGTIELPIEIEIVEGYDANEEDAESGALPQDEPRDVRTADAEEPK
jgi:Tfp pilus assembly PilM family ATPase